ncbi:ribonuclease H, mammalian HI/archaeal HII subfamily [Halovivax ruber XH-70]|uniref:Ribonuclease n=1 Tax=Halovivax ruber (strain DSM 18193 / JCM 13892 / XH-70) TaxID=797302 RepID=L0I7Q9_HALRX|nr:ribonuclease HII [Halovivax ruber]AGB14734.1 ribonuclease H, mammalian HI/archaeal HII subfamily [Halovivax ruber XH-70]
MVFGVDEAGKGPAIGPMIAVAVRVADRSHLPDGMADSKDLAPDRREDLAARLRAADDVAVGVCAITSDRIDDPETDMNGLAVAAHAGAIEAALADAGLDGAGTDDDPPAGICDACDTDADRFARRVTDACSPPIDVAAKHGADADDPLVGAASIVAKVERDARMADIAATYADAGYGDPGSGYPSDPKTRAFLEAHVDETGRLPDCARRSWATCRDVLADAQQSGLADFAGE